MSEEGGSEIPSRETIAALVRSSPQSIEKIAEAAGMYKANLIAWLKGRRSIPAKQKSGLMAVLGLDEEGFTPGAVHLVEFGRDLSDLRLVVFALAGSTLKYAPILHESADLKSRSELVIYRLFALYGGGIYMILRRNLADAASSYEDVSPDTVLGLQFDLGQDRHKRVHILPLPDYQRWSQGEVDAREFSSLVEEQSPLSWAPAQKICDDLGIKPAAVVEWVRLGCPGNAV